MNLAFKKCVPCEGGMPPLTPDESMKLHQEIPTWQLMGNRKIQKDFSFKDFKEAMAFVNRVADIAEAEGHHPDISVAYNKVHIDLWTHAVKGLSENDFILAAKIDAITL